MKKTLIVLFLFVFILPFMVRGEDLKWNDKIEDGIALGKKENKPIFLLFTGSDWCPWCVKLEKELLSSKEVQDYLKGLVLIKLDYRRKKDPVSKEREKYILDNKKKYGVKGFPTIILIDSKGNVKDKIGYQKVTPAQYVENIKKKIK